MLRTGTYSRSLTFTLAPGRVLGLLVPGAQGGLGQPPYGTFFFDLSAANPGDSLAAGATN